MRSSLRRLLRRVDVEAGAKPEVLCQRVVRHPFAARDWCPARRRSARVPRRRRDTRLSVLRGVRAGEARQYQTTGSLPPLSHCGGRKTRSSCRCRRAGTVLHEPVGGRHGLVLADDLQDHWSAGTDRTAQLVAIGSRDRRDTSCRSRPRECREVLDRVPPLATPAECQRPPLGLSALNPMVEPLPLAARLDVSRVARRPATLHASPPVGFRSPGRLQPTLRASRHRLLRPRGRCTPQYTGRNMSLS